jgi:general secretion pathway protein I
MIFSSARRYRGFTLIEVMVAVAIVGLALPALMSNVMQQVDNTSYIRDKIISQWVASNKMAEYRIAARQGSVPVNGKKQGATDMLGKKWFWKIDTKKFPQPELSGVYGVQVEVRREKEDEDPIITLFSALK